MSPSRRLPGRQDRTRGDFVPSVDRLQGTEAPTKQRECVVGGGWAGLSPRRDRTGSTPGSPCSSSPGIAGCLPSVRLPPPPAAAPLRGPRGTCTASGRDRSALCPLRGPALLSVSQQPFVAVTWPGLEFTGLERKICILRRLFCQTRSETGRLYSSPQGRSPQQGGSRRPV